jgi:hypothetical protein
MSARWTAVGLLLPAISLAPARTSCADPPAPAGNLLRNGDFEQGANGAPEAWTHDAWKPERSLFAWEPSGGVDGSRCISITTSGEPNDAWWKQTLELEPRTAYLLRGRIRAENVEPVQPDAFVGANLCQLGVFGCVSDAERSKGSFDWTDFQVDFVTGESGSVEIGCRLGHWNSTVKGKAYFDDLILTRNPHVTRREGRHVYLNLYDDDTAVITPEHYDRWIAHLDAAYEAMADLVGHAPFGGAKIGIYSSIWYPGGWAVAGNPICWHQRYVQETLRAADEKDDWSFGLVHELGHDFDEDGSWDFHAEFWANFKLYYVMETLNARMGDYVGADQIRYWKSDSGIGYEKAWLNPDPAKRVASNDGLQYKMILIRQKIGWEPFKQTFRYFLSLPENERPTDNWSKLKLFHDQLAEFSGYDVWSLYTPDDLKLMKVEYR